MQTCIAQLHSVDRQPVRVCVACTSLSALCDRVVVPARILSTVTTFWLASFDAQPCEDIVLVSYCVIYNVAAEISRAAAVSTAASAAVLLHSLDRNPSQPIRAATRTQQQIQAADMHSQRLGAGRLQQQHAVHPRQQQQCRAVCSRHSGLQQHAGYTLQPLQLQRMQLLQPRVQQQARQRQLHVVAAAGSQPPETTGQTGFLSSLYK